MKEACILLIMAACTFVILSCSSYSAENKNIEIKKQPEIQQIKPKKPVKIKLKRSAEGRYAWELAGDDVNEIVRADKRLRRFLDAE